MPTFNTDQENALIYRPVSLMSTVSEMLKFIIRKQTANYLQRSNYLRFRGKRSHITNLDFYDSELLAYIKKDGLVD